MNKFTFLKSYFSPFRPCNLKFYAGKIKIGTPYFLPRRWVKYTEKEAREAALKAIEDSKKVEKTLEEWLEYYMVHEKAVPKKIGFDFIGLGWKTKWREYRFEWPPLISFVFFKWQIAVIFDAPEKDHYWESWLYYELETDKTKTKKERISQCRKNYPQIWKRYNKEGEEIKVDYYDIILKKRYK
jgi:hypothetical protein